MPKARPVTPEECERVALFLRFQFKNQVGSHKHFKKEGVGKVTIPQYKEISGDLFRWICRQLKISKKKFFEILENYC
ncbi:type II toxin-antitoxin system HicA family toxin [Candidatus Gracilibacteria bacterium]|nr:type II toxin-antitoxin system HicA family toxin [Candidatus Gracilibacteria bacterium]